RRCAALAAPRRRWTGRSTPASWRATSCAPSCAPTPARWPMPGSITRWCRRRAACRRSWTSMASERRSNMQAIIQPLLSLLTLLAPGASTTVITQVIQLLTALIPSVVQEYQALLPIVQNIIAVLKTSDDITPDQWNQLDAMSAQYDADFQAALVAAEAQDTAAAAKT